jgi:16S rRNA G527 N7-methylase RsmG
MEIKKMSERIKKKLNNYIESLHKKNQEMNLVKYLKKEVEIGANGTQKYVVKNGANKGKVL